MVEGSNKYYYPPENNYGYPPPQDNSYPLPATPLPQRVSSVTADSYPPNNDGYPMQMPVPQYQHHYHQRHASNNSIDQTSVYPPQQYNNGTPPGSPGMNHAVYPPVGYPDATQDLINNSYRPTFVSHASDASTPTVSGKPTPPLPAASGFRPQPSASTHRRTHSSLRNNMIMTIERPRYTYLPETDSTNGEVPFIPVSPDTDSEEEEEYFTTHRVNEHSPVEPPVTLDPVIIQPQDVQYVDPSAQEVAALEQHVGQLQLENEARQFQAVEPEAEEALLMPEERKPAEPNYGLLSLLSIQFIRAVKGLENVRELWCASEYNESFTGSEAVTIIRNLLKDQVPDDYCILVASALMRSDPALFSPTQYSQKSLISNTVNADDTYFLEEDISDDYTPIGVLPSLTPCYSYTCRPGMGGCYSESCPNTGKDFFVNTKVKIKLE